MYNNIGIDSTLNWKRIKKLLTIGLVASCIAFVADWILGYGNPNASLAGIEWKLSCYTKNDFMIFLSGVLGLIGISIEGLSYFGIYRLMAEKSAHLAHIYRTGIFGYMMFGACGCHVSCCALLYVYHHTSFDIALQFAKYFVLPSTIFFIIFFIILCYGQIKAFCTGMTPYPKWCWIFSLPVGMALAMLVKVLGNHPVVNAITCGWISVGNIWMFTGLLLMMKRVKKS